MMQQLRKETILKVMFCRLYNVRGFCSAYFCFLGLVALSEAVATSDQPTLPVPTSVPAVKEEITKPPAPPHWGYLAKSNQTEDLMPNTWSKAYPICDGQRQSPIALETRFIANDFALKPFTFVRYDAASRNDSWAVINNGHVAQFSGRYVTPPEIHGGSLGEDYVFLQFHFHWGAVNTRGSEHMIDEQRFPLELHIVHRKSAFYDSEAAGDSTGLAVLGIMFELSVAPMDTNDPHFVHIDAMITALAEVQNPGQSKNVTLQGFRLMDLLPSSPVYYRYLGSLTTPPCAEAVIWTVFREPMKITQAQLNTFRSLREHAGVPANDTSNTLVDNFRPVQHRNGRDVKMYTGEVSTTVATRATFVTTEVVVSAEALHAHPVETTTAQATTVKGEEARGSAGKGAAFAVCPLLMSLLVMHMVLDA